MDPSLTREAQGAAPARDDQRLRPDAAAGGVSSTQYDRYKCGPLEIVVASETEKLRRKIADTLDLYNVEWTEPLTQWQIEISESDATTPLGPGAYLQCARMHVELTGNQLLATCPSGAQAVCDRHTRRWTM